MPYMENAANAKRNLTAPRNRIFEDVDTQQAFFAGQAALQAADKKSVISEEKAMRAQTVSEQALQAADLATVRYQLAANFANHEAMQQSRAQQLEAARNARRAATDAVLARADSERSKGRIPGAARHDSLFYAADLSAAGHPSSKAPDKADTDLLGAIAAAAVLQAAQAHNARIPSGTDTVFEPSDEPPAARDTLTALPRAMEQTVGDAPRRAALLAEPQQRIVQTRAPYVTDAQIEADAEYESRINRKAEETAEAKEKYETAVHSLQELDEKIKAAEAVFVQENHAYRETPSELRYNSLRAAAENYRNLLGQYFRAYQNLPSLQKAYEKNSAQLQKADAYIARVEKQRAYQKTTVRPEAAVKADIAALNAEIEGYENIVYGLKVKRQEAQSGTYDREILENELKIKQIEEVKKKYEEELSWAHYFSYDDLRNRADFAELSQYQKDPRDGTEKYEKDWHGRPNEPWYSALYEAMNGNKEAQDALYDEAIYTSTRKTFGSPGAGAQIVYDTSKKGKAETKFATPEQTQFFNYYYRKYGKEAAEKFYEERLRDDLMLQQREESERKWREFATKNAGTAILATIGSVLESPMKGASYLMQLADYLEDGKIDENAAYNNFSRWNTATRDAIMEKMNRSGTWGKVGSFAYGVGTSMADFAWQTLLSGGFSAAGSAAAKRISEAVALGIMGTGAAADATIAAKDRGLTDDRAFALGTIAGAAEILTEKFSVEALLEGVGNRRAWQYILKNAFTEGTEEVGSDVINFFADVLIAKDKSQWKEAIRSYEADGKNEKQAFLLAVRDQALSMGESFLGGFLSGGIMATVGAGVTVGSTKKWQRSEYQEAGKRLRESGSDTVERMIGGAQTMQEQPQIKLLADQLAAKQREKTLSDEEIGRLFYAIMESGDTVSKRPPQASEQTAPGEIKGENAEEKSVLSKLYDADLQRAAGAEQQGAPDSAEKSASSGQDGTQDGATAETYAQMQEKTAVNTDPATHTPEEQAIIEEYQKSVDPDLVEYAEGVKNGAQVGKSYSFGSIPQRLQQDIRRLLQVDTSQYSNELTMDDTRHILKRHGENGVHDRSMRNLEDIGRIPYVVENYDGIEKLPDITAAVSNADGTPAPMLKLRKKVNGTFYVVEAVPVSAAKRLRIISAYMDSAKKGQKLNQALNMKVTSPQPTSETLLGSVASAEPSIARGESGVKKNRSTKSDKTGVQKAADALYEADKTHGEDAASLVALRKEVLDKTYQQLYNEKEIKWAERHGYTLLQESDYVKLSRESGWSPETVRWITTWEQYELLKSAGLHEERICGRLCLVKDHIDADYVFVAENGMRISNREQMQKGNSPRDAATGKPIELHHLGQDANSPFVELTPEEHRLSGNYSIWHANRKPSWREIDGEKSKFNKEREKHWKTRLQQIEKRR